jgi:hypothetical protein
LQIAPRIHPYLFQGSGSDRKDPDPTWSGSLIPNIDLITSLINFVDFHTTNQVYFSLQQAGHHFIASFPLPNSHYGGTCLSAVDSIYFRQLAVKRRPAAQTSWAIGQVRDNWGVANDYRRTASSQVAKRVAEDFLSSIRRSRASATQRKVKLAFELQKNKLDLQDIYIINMGPLYSTLKRPILKLKSVRKPYFRPIQVF